MLEELLDLERVLDVPLPVSGGARNFDAVNDIITRSGDDAGLDVPDGSSVILQVLVKPEDAATSSTIAGKKNSTGVASAAGYQLRIVGGSSYAWSVSDSVDQDSKGSTTVPSNGVWKSVTGVLKANAAADDDNYIYVETTQENSVTGLTLLGSLENARPFRVGANSNSTPAGFFDGDIAYARVWIKGSAWTQAEIDQVIQAHNRLYLPAGWGPSTMRLQWVLWDAGSPSTTLDLSGNGLTGTYTDTTAVSDPARVMGPGGSPVRLRHTAPVAATTNPGWYVSRGGWF